MQTIYVTLTRVGNYRSWDYWLMTIGSPQFLSRRLAHKMLRNGEARLVRDSIASREAL